MQSNALKLEGDEKIGGNIVRRALEEPLRQIVENAGEEGAIVVGKIKESKDPNFGYNAQTNQFEDLVKAGVIDPDQGHAHRAAECRLDRGPDAHHRSPGSRRFRKRRRNRRCLTAAAAWAECTKGSN